VKFKTNYLARLIESKDKNGKEWEVVLIQAGKSLNGKTYLPEVLKKRLNLFENAKAYAYEFKGKIWNHLPEAIRRIIPEGCIKNIVGWYENPYYASFKDDSGETQEGILAKFHIAENAEWLRKFLKDAWEHGKKSLLGFSIDGDGDVSKEGIVEDIRSIDEITIVSNPAAGGQLCRLLAGLDIIGEAQMDWLKKLYEFAKRIKEGLIEGIDIEKITPEQEITLIKGIVESEDIFTKELKEDAFISEFENKLIEMIEAGKVKEAITYLKQLKSKLTASAPAKTEPAKTEPAKTEPAKTEPAKTEPAKTEPAKTEPAAGTTESKTKELDEAILKANKMVEETHKANCEAMLIKVLSESKLPEAIKEKVKEQFKEKTFEKVELDKVLDSERKTLDKLAESLGIEGLGSTKAEVTADAQDKLQVALDLMVDPEAEVDTKLKESVGGKGFRGLKEAYIAFNPNDPDVSMGINPLKKRLTENIITTDFSYALGTSMTRKIGKEYVKVEFMFDPIVAKVPLSNFKQQEIIRWGGYSRLPTVAQRGTYQDLYEPHDEQATYTPGKKGGVIYVSRETIKNDDLRFIQTIPKKVAKASRATLSFDLANYILANSTYTPSGTAWATAAYKNYSTDNLSYDHLTDAKVEMRGRRERGTSQLAGTATAGSSTTLSDTSESAVILDNVFDDYYLRIVYGTGAGQVRLISNTATSGSTFTVTPAWDVTPSTDSKYEVSAAKANDERIGLKLEYVVHGDALEAKIGDLTTAQTNPEDAASGQPNAHKKVVPIYCPYFEGATYQYYWASFANKVQTDIFEVGFVDGQENPMVLVADDPKVGSNLTADDIVYKIRYEYGYTMADNAGARLNLGTGV